MAVELALLSTVAYRGREVTAPRLRALLVLLAGDLKAGCGVHRLVEGLWAQEPPENPGKAVHVLVSRVRAQLGADLVVSTATGYRLALGEDQVDATAIQLNAAAAGRAARAGDHEEALAQAEAGLLLWDGTAGGDGDPVAEFRQDHVPAWRSLTRAKALALGRLGRHAEAVGLLEGLFDERPRDEELLVELLRAQAATTSPAAALSRYDAYRRSLRDELGADPGAALQGVHQALLRGDTTRRGVLHEPNALLGRENDITAVTDLLRDARVVSVTGPGGLGKTRLAHAVGRGMTGHNVYFVALAGVGGDEDVAGEVAAVLGAGAQGPKDLLRVVGDIPAVIVLDNCEHVIEGAAELARALVSMTKDLRILTTSRAALGLSSESVYQLGELPLDTAAELFVQRAKAARPGVDLPVGTVAEICGHLDGLPLAIELAAARVRVMSVGEIAKRLDDRFALLRGGSRDSPERHQTLYAVVDWSWNLLSENQQAAMATLSIFPGGFTAEAAEHVLGGGVWAVLEHLADHSLVKVADTPAGARFQMLETVREFSAQHRDHEHAVTLFLAWARNFGLANHDQVLGPDALPATQRVVAEQDNLVQALRYAIDREDSATVAAAGAVLAGVWLVGSHYSRIAALADDCAWVLTHFPPAPAYVEVTRTIAAICAAHTFMIQGPRAVRSLVILRRLPPAPPDTLPRAGATLLTTLAQRPGMSTVYELVDSPYPLLAALAGFVASYFEESDLDPYAALESARRVPALLGNQGNPWFRQAVHLRIGELSMRVGESELALRHLHAALSVVEPDVTGIGYTLAMVSLSKGDLESAGKWLEHAHGQQGDHTLQLGVQAEIMLARGEIDAGLRAWRRALAYLDPSAGTEYRVEPLGMDPWLDAIRAVTVVAHAQHDQLEKVADLVALLSRRLVWLLEHPTANPSPLLMESPVWGALLLAVGMADRHRAPGLAVRMIALAERLRYVRDFQPTMSEQRAQDYARQTDGPAYADAVSEYAGLDRDELRPAALAVLTDRESAG